MQSLLWDRRIVLAILDAVGVPTPPRLVISRDGGAKVDPDAAKAFYERTGMDIHRVLEKYMKNTTDYSISEDGIEVEGTTLKKTFLEKPVDSEDHNINIYYSREQGGGGRRLFRKVKLDTQRLSVLISDGHIYRLVTSQVSLIQI